MTRTTMLAAFAALALPRLCQALPAQAPVRGPGTAPEGFAALAPFSGVRDDDPWIGTLRSLGPLSSLHPGLDGLDRLSPFLDPGDRRYNPDVAGGLRDALSGEPALREFLDGLVRTWDSGGASVRLTEDDERKLNLLAVARQAAATRTAQALGEINPASINGHAPRLEEFLGALTASGLYPDNGGMRRNGEAVLAKARQAARLLLPVPSGDDSTGPEVMTRGDVRSLRPSPASPGFELQDELVVAASPAMTDALALARLAATDPRAEKVGVLITGESGSGKEVVARAIHRMGGRSGAPFIGVNVAAIPPDLVESELFGHVKGAYTGAREDRIGHFEAAGEGVLLLDEIGDLPLPLQAKLLDVIEGEKFHRLGENENATPRSLRARLLFATHRDLKSMVAGGSFREDLYYRINGLQIRLPPLRERPEEIPRLAQELMRRLLAADQRLVGRRLSSDALDLLTRHPWPGNVRELRNVLARAMALSVGAEIQPSDLYFDGVPTEPVTPRTMRSAVDPSSWLEFVFSRVAKLSLPLLVRGETGTGKNVIVRRLHSASGREGPLVIENVTAHPESLIESEIFGHVKGAFTDAGKAHVGWLQAAEGGTLVLNEIGDMPLGTQVKLLRVLESGRYIPVGGTSKDERRLSARIVAVTHRDLAALVREKKFRADLYFRLNVLELMVKPLRERRGEIPELIRVLLHESGPDTPISAEAMSILLAHDWPGNVRQLRNAVLSAAVRSRGSEIQPGHLPEEVLPQHHDAAPAPGSAANGHGGAFGGWPLNWDLVEKIQILRVSERVGGDRTILALRLGITPDQLRGRLKKHRIELPEAGSGVPADESETLAFAERHTIMRALDASKRRDSWNMNQVVKATGIVRQTLKKRITAYGIVPRSPTDWTPTLGPKDSIGAPL